ncbi:MAG: hypothetical protein ACR2NB_10665 [Solirubrobacteraceae bacterium]
MQTKLITGAVALCLALVGTGAAVAAQSGPAPKRATIRAVQTVKVKVNRYVLDGMRWQKDTYSVRSGGTVRVVNDAPDEGPHTFTFVKKSDLPRTPMQILQHCRICEELGKAHGADPHSDGPPKFKFLENGVGQNTPPNFDQPGDSALIAPRKGSSINLPVTAKKGKTLYFMCLIHPWMQGKLLVR